MPLPEPEPALVISYAYLWHHEYRVGQEEARKDRPSVILLVTEQPAEGANIVTVLPITHTAPSDPGSAVEMPLPVKRNLGLDDARSCVVVAEGNEFIWPGYDLRQLPHSDRYHYGFLPPRFFAQIVKVFVTYHRRGRRRISPRD